MKNLKYLILLLLLVSLSGCFATRNRCLRLYPPEVSRDTVVHETVRDSVVLKDTTIIVSIPGETIVDSIPFPVYVANNITMDTIRTETDYAKAKAYYSNGMIHLELIQKETYLEVKLERAIRENYHLSQYISEISNREVVKVKYTPAIYKVALWAWFGVLMAFILAFIAHRLKLF